MRSCRHFRFRLPREVADELRDADPSACEVCDAMPHRRGLASSLAKVISTSVLVENRDVLGSMAISLAVGLEESASLSDALLTQETAQEQSSLERVE